MAKTKRTLSTTRWFVALAALGAALAGSSCAYLTGGRRSAVMAPMGDPARGQRFNEVMEARRWRDALSIIRGEIDATPGGGRMLQAHLRIAGIGAAAKYGENELQAGTDLATLEDLDRDVRRWGEEAFAQCGDDDDCRGHVNSSLAVYDAGTARMDEALAYARRALAQMLRAGSDVGIVAALWDLGAIFSDMGELEIAHQYRRQALAYARGHFPVQGFSVPRGGWSDGRDNWMWYAELLQRALLGSSSDDAVRPKTTRAREYAAELRQTADTMDKVVAHLYGHPIVGTRVYLANRLAALGYGDEAREEVAKARHLQSEYTRLRALEGRTTEDFDSYRACQLAALSVELEDGVRGLAYLKACQQRDESDDVPGSRDARLRMAGRIYELAGRPGDAIASLEPAIASCEASRSAYGIVRRTSFFRGVCHKAYWGMVRSLVARRAPGDIARAADAAESMRARQFHDQVAAASVSPPTTVLARAQRALSADELVLSFLVTDTSTIVFVVSAKDAQVHVLPVTEAQLYQDVMRVRRLLADDSSDVARIETEMSRLGGALLGPFAHRLEQRSRVLVVPDGALGLLPVDLLSYKLDSYRPLILDRTVVILPSLSDLVSARAARRAADGIALREGFFGVADPVYRSGRIVGVASPADILAVRGTAGIGDVSPLPETRQEVERIAALFPGEPVRLLVGDEAVESNVENLALDQYRYLHFATHGVTGQRIPGLGEPALILGEEAHSDGFLTASEVMALHLRADVTVLSACETGVGELVTGEGVMGMGRAFLAAGSRAVIVSLWSIESTSTATLMEAYYARLRAGTDPADALRFAKLDLWHRGWGRTGVSRGLTVVSGDSLRDEDLDGPSIAMQGPLHPFFWAPFVFVGTQ